MFDTSQPVWLTVTHRSSYILLLLTIAISLGSLLAPRLLKPRIKLEDQDDVQPKTRKGLLSKTILGHIDADLGSHGEYVDLPGFWKKVRPGRWLVLLLSLVNLFLSLFMLRTRLSSFVIGAWTYLRLTGEISTALYITVLAVSLVRSSAVPTHETLLSHICVISAFSFVHWYLVTFGQYLSVFTPTYIDWTEYTVFALAGAMVIASGSINLSPKLHQDLTRLYNNNVTNKLLKGGYDPAACQTHNVVEEVSASIIGRLGFVYVYPLLSKAKYLEQLDVDDLPAAHAWSRTQNMAHDAVTVNDTNGLTAQRGPAFSLFWTVWYAQRSIVIKYLGTLLISIPLFYIPHWALQNILYILEKGLNRQSAVAFAGLYMIARGLDVMVSMQQMNLSSTMTNPRIRSHTSYLLYQKLLTRNTFATGPSTGKDADTGKAVLAKADIINLCSSDTTQMSRLGWHFVDILQCFMQLLLGCACIWVLLGPSGFVGLASLIFTIPPAYILTRMEYRVFEAELKIKDEKVTLLQEAIQAISMIKMMATEKYWYNRVNGVRDREFGKLIQARSLGAVSGLLYEIAPTVVVIVAFAHYTLVAKQTLTASIAFTAIGVFESLKPALSDLPRTFADLLRDWLSSKRIGSFLRSPDLDYLSQNPTNGDAIPSFDKVYIHGTVAWDAAPLAIENDCSPAVEGAADQNSNFQLDLDVEFPRGELTLIAGRFGSGKSLLLLSLLGETKLIEGKISYLASSLLDPKDAAIPDWSLKKGGVAYVPQTPWLQSLSIRDNILFGLPMDFDRYRTVLHAVGLMPDLEVLEDADLTEIGERGKILSGGQKARVSLARSCYSSASVLLLDDVISAVDAECAKHIIENCFKAPIMAGRTIIIASHAVEAIAPLAAHAIYLEGGTAAWTGTGPQLLESEYMGHLKTDTDVNRSAVVADEEKTKENENTGDSEKKPFEIVEATPKTPRQLILEENRVPKGGIGINRWTELKRFNGTNLYWIVLASLLLTTTLAPVASRRVLELWTGGAEEAKTMHSIVFWVTLYSCLSVAAEFIASGYRFLRFWGGVRAAKRIHSQMLESVLRAQMSFFTHTRAGSILQRFGEDLNDVLEASDLLGTMSERVVTVITNIVVVTVQGGWQFGLVCVILLLGVIKPGQYYAKYSGQIRRLESIIPGPINAIFSETVAGSAVIRAYGAHSLFMDNLLREMNMKIVTTNWRFFVARWIILNSRILDLIINATILTIILSRKDITGATAGFMLIFAGQITTNVMWTVTQFREFELKGVSLSRTAEYRHLQREGGKALDESDSMTVLRGFGEDEGDDVVQAENWPSEGKISVQDLKVKYGGRDMPEILHGVSFEVQGGQSVGIVGATGGGKSTLAKAFFSFVETTAGKIEIDGMNIADLPLNQVRRALGIIAQDPILLSGTLRLNLDLEGVCEDHALYDALRQVQLITPADGAVAGEQGPNGPDGSSRSSENETDSEETVVGSSDSTPKNGAEQTNLFTNLDSEIKSGGDNLSAGQKQLVVLARALLKQPKVLILDEATASIDSATDAEISRVVHEKFEGVTVLIIAHRLRTVMPCSKILVMDRGNLIQQGTPLELIKQDGGKFQELCKAAGMEEYQHLLSLAQESDRDHAA